MTAIKIAQSDSQLPIEKVELDSFGAKPEANATSDFEYKEGGWGWVVVVATGYCFAILIGMVNNYALIHNKFVTVYNGTENHVFYSGWIGSLSMGIQFFLCAFGSILIDLYGPRKIGLLGAVISTLSVLSCAFVTDLKLYFLTYGVIYGVGQAFLLAATLAILPHYFNKRLALANGLMSGLSAIVIIVLPIITAAILRSYGLKETFYVLAALNLVTVIMACTFRPMLPSNADATFVSRLKDSFGMDVFKNVDFVIWCVAGFVGIYGYMIPIVYIDHFSQLNFPSFSPEILNIAFGASSGLASIGFGKLGDITKFNRVHYHTASFLVAGFLQMLLPFANSFYVLAVMFTLLGIVDGIVLSFIVPIAYDLSGSSKLTNQATGYFHSFLAPTSVAGPAIAGLIFEKRLSFDYAFYMGGVSSLFAAAILVIFIFFVGMCRNKRSAPSPVISTLKTAHLAE